MIQFSKLLKLVKGNNFTEDDLHELMAMAGFEGILEEVPHDRKKDAFLQVAQLASDSESGAMLFRAVHKSGRQIRGIIVLGPGRPGVTPTPEKSLDMDQAIPLPSCQSA